MNNIYLSIDLDYFFMYYGLTQAEHSFITNWFDKVLSLGITPTVVMEHHELLDSINDSSCDTIYNVDYHTDIDYEVGNCKVELTEGTFFFFVDNRKENEYKWYMPSRYECHSKGYYNGHCDGEGKTFHKKYWIFKKQSYVQGLPRLKNISHIGISISPDWIDYEGLVFAKEKLWDFMDDDLRMRVKKLIDK